MTTRKHGKTISVILLTWIAFAVPRLLLAGVTNRVLFVDQDGNVSSTNALATQAELAAVASSNELVIAEQAAVRNGYNTATQLLTYAAQSVISTPVVFMSVEFTGFEAAVTFDENSKVTVTDIDRTSEQVTVNGVQCFKTVLDFAFQESLQTVKPFIEFSSNLDTPKADWDFLADDFVSSPTAKSGSWTDKGGNVYNNLYSIDIAVPAQYASSGFFGIWIPNDAASSDGSVMDMPGVKDGYTGTQSWGGHTLTFKGGYLVGVADE